MLWVLIVGLLMNVIALPIAARRVLFLDRLITSGQPAPDRVEDVTGRLGKAVKTQVVEVFGQKKLLKWSVPGAAHFFVFWAFLILGDGLPRGVRRRCSHRPGFRIPIVGHWAVLGFAQDFIAVMALVGLVTFAMIRLKNAPAKLGRKSRFIGLAPGRRLAGPVHDLQRHLDDVPVPRRRLRRRQPALRQRRVRLDRRSATCSTGSATTPSRSSRASGCCCTSASCWSFLIHRAQLQAPAHLPGAAQRAVRARARSRSARPSR